MLPLLGILLFSCYSQATSRATANSTEFGGYYAGVAPVCVDTEKEAHISKENLKYLTIAVAGNNTHNKERQRYTYHEMSHLARNPNVDFQRKKTIIHFSGYLDSPNFVYAGSIATAYKSLGYNVLLVDTSMFTTFEFPHAVRLIRGVGKVVAEMLAELTNEGMNPKHVELIGISLGAQAASFTAKNYKRITGRKISRITALDPSGPCFRNLGINYKIHKSDADFVEIIGTSIDNYGSPEPLGHVNYYVNGGDHQPGEGYWFQCDSLCSHLRSHVIWLSAVINPNTFIAIQCDSMQQARRKECYDREPQVTNVLGLNVDKTKHGIFYLATTNRYPYSLGEKGTKKENDFELSLLLDLNSVDVLKV